MNKQLMAGLAAAAILLTACGGGDDSSPSPVVTPPTPAADMPPDSASQTIEGLVAYLQSLAGALSETAEAVDVSQFTPAQSDTADSTPVN